MPYYFHLLNKVFHSSVFLESLVTYQTCDLSYNPEYFSQDSFEYRISSFGHAKKFNVHIRKDIHIIHNYSRISKAKTWAEYNFLLILCLIFIWSLYLWKIYITDNTNVESPTLNVVGNLVTLKFLLTPGLFLFLHRILVGRNGHGPQHKCHFPGWPPHSRPASFGLVEPY